MALIKKSRTKVVMKIFEKENLVKKDRRKAMLSEIGILKNSNHPNIIKYLECVTTND